MCDAHDHLFLRSPRLPARSRTTRGRGRAGGASVVHLEMGTAALDVLDLLCGGSGVPGGRVILGHLNRSSDLVVQRQAAGCRPAFDGPSRANHATD